MSKVCSGECGLERDDEFFYSGRNVCKICHRKRMNKHYENNKETMNAVNRKRYAENKDTYNETRRKKYHNDDEYRANVDHQQQNYKPKRRVKRKTLENRKKAAEYKKKWRTNIVNKLRDYVSNAVRAGLLSGKTDATWKHLPYTPEQLKKHLESHFEEWMSWENFGRIDLENKTWNIDHIIPQSKLLYDSFEHENFLKCWSLENLVPLLAKDNLEKSSS